MPNLSSMSAISLSYNCCNSCIVLSLVNFITSKMSFSVWQVMLLTLGPHEKVVTDWGEPRLSQSVFQHHPPLKGRWTAKHVHVDGSWRAASGASFQVLGRELGYRGPGPLPSPLTWPLPGQE